MLQRLKRIAVAAADPHGAIDELAHRARYRTGEHQPDRNVAAMLAAHGVFEVRKHRVRQTEPVLARSLGQHFIIGYRSFDEVAPLVEKGFVAGIYITRRNVAGRTAGALKAEIATLQARRRAAGLPPLVVATDREGGIVSHLAPPLTRLPALASLAELAPEEQKAKAEEFGRIHRRELASLGIKLNFAPVLDCARRRSTTGSISIR
jgi:beta-N-acetylhexosaminidase